MTDQERINKLTKTLQKISLELIAAGNTEPKPWHSSNEKNSFPIFKRMGEEGMLTIAEVMF
jgi:hypothetical protein